MRVSVLICCIIVMANQGLCEELLYESDSENVISKVDEIHLKGYDPLAIGNILPIFAIDHHNGTVAITNRDNVEILLFSPSGEMTAHFGKPGRGPDELMTTITRGFDQDGNLWIYDYQQDLLKSYSEDGDFITSKPGFIEDGIWIRGNLLYSIDDAWFFAMELAGAGQHTEGEGIAKYSSEFELIATGGEFDPIYHNSRTILAQPYIAVDKKRSQIIMVQRTSPYIQVFDSNLELITRKKGDKNYFKQSDRDILMRHSMEERNQMLLERSLVEDPWVTDDHLIFVFTNYDQKYFTSRDPQDLIQYAAIYDLENFELLAEFRLPHRIAGVLDNKLLLLENDNPDNIIIGKYILNL